MGVLSAISSNKITMNNFEVIKQYDDIVHIKHLASGLIFVAEKDDKEIYHLSFSMSWEQAQKLDLTYIVKEYREFIKTL